MLYPQIPLNTRGLQRRASGYVLNMTTTRSPIKAFRVESVSGINGAVCGRGEMACFTLWPSTNTAFMCLQQQPPD
ncbi:hypothetical protein AALO_G00014970 [Alosa alosa]|uniref:Uncharacterized protein n=1 Tax=Alosa alosa TaxID=278164 RepID=A0AAV6HGI0_9TELE|nr:hypothetical protein AALO_G00014970 [Alosa alosa]